MQITLLRHGKTEFSHKKLLSSESFSNWVKSYNLSGLCESSQPSDSTVEHVAKCNAVICSELHRSKESARKLKIYKIDLTSSLFNEAGLPVVKVKYMKLPTKIWLVLFRLLWLFGYSGNSESFRETKKRATEATNILVEFAKEHDHVLFIGHGVYNRILSRKLLELGWAGEKLSSTKHWGYSVYTYR